MDSKMVTILLLVCAVMIQMVTAAEITRRRKMLVRRKVPVPNGLSQNRDRLARPVRVIKKKIISSPVLSSPLESEVTTVPPQSRPFSVKETVPPKPDAVKRCKTNIPGTGNN